MQLKNLALAASVVATAAASPAAAADSGSQYFGVIAIHSGSGVQNAGFNAAKGGLIAGLKDKSAGCETTNFYISEGSLYIYDNTARTQEIFVDRSGMGQGLIGYTVGVQPAPKNTERKGWAIKDTHLQFDGSDLIACATADGYKIWASAGVAAPGGYTDCVSIAARVVEIAEPVACWAT
ncbi:hypothetical protein BDV28DRAFT_112222 [Aspergillus coremiiformis]|uniref:Cell wall protein PhiA n=1 Tax=Aspergillus coremiiformis TaxID=138285 RepID=A0A5N6Z8X9_9EURO|nr:hypothetical protein BDV28DRAFT_112222 [Aspergillus coremiiformis]